MPVSNPTINRRTLYDRNAATPAITTASTVVRHLPRGHPTESANDAADPRPKKMTSSPRGSSPILARKRRTYAAGGSNSPAQPKRVGLHNWSTQTGTRATKCATARTPGDAGLLYFYQVRPHQAFRRVPFPGGSSQEIRPMVLESPAFCRCRFSRPHGVHSANWTGQLQEARLRHLDNGKETVSTRRVVLEPVLARWPMARLRIPRRRGRRLRDFERPLPTAHAVGRFSSLCPRVVGRRYSTVLSATYENASVRELASVTVEEAS